jgi:hypothetical protein
LDCGNSAGHARIDRSEPVASARGIGIHFIDQVISVHPPNDPSLPSETRRSAQLMTRSSVVGLPVNSVAVEV